MAYSAEDLKLSLGQNRHTTWKDGSRLGRVADSLYIRGTWLILCTASLWLPLSDSVHEPNAQLTMQLS